MPDYMYLLESRLSPEQRAALERVQELARSQEMNIYLTGGAVRDLISGQPIRDLDFTVEGNPVRMVRELEKGGARVLSENEKIRHFEMIFAGDADGSIAAARDDVYERPGAKPEYRFAGIMEDLRRRDFSINAIAISLNANSRGLLLDPTNGLADLERQEVRALSIHAFTNQPIRLLRILRYCARMSFNMDSRTQEWFDLAMQRGLQDRIDASDVGHELRALSREENAVPALKQWESRELLVVVHPQLQRRKPDYEALNKLSRVRMNFLEAGIRPRLRDATTRYTLQRLKPREMVFLLRNLNYTQSEIDAIVDLPDKARAMVKVLKSRKTESPRDAYFYMASVPPEMLAFIEAEIPDARAVSKIRNYLQKWRPLRLALPVAELDFLGVPRGPKFDQILEQFFEKQLRGKGKTPEERTKLLRDLAGIKDEPPRKPEKKRKGKEAAAESGANISGKGRPTMQPVRAAGKAPKPVAAAAQAPAPAKPAAPVRKAGKHATPKTVAAKTSRRK
ncbi:MAG: CCA tRNA nucleotidyltransferase [Acidobacteriota bacterium]|nr:CCA tRNA nucleotidyltransferase [Acidobacteriota bacterium]